MMYFIMALDALDYAQDHPDRVEAIRHFESLLIETEDRFMFQPCVSPIWDTAICAFAMGEAGVNDDPRHDARGRLADQQRGPAQGRLEHQAPRYRALGMGLRVRQRVLPRYRRHRHGAAGADARQGLESGGADGLRAARHQLAARDAIGDGGWAAFDVDNNWAVLNQVPFADHNAMLDPTCPDITGRVLECLCRRGMAGHEAVRRGVAYLLRCAGKGWQLVRPLGRELHLRIVPGDARPGG